MYLNNSQPRRIIRTRKIKTIFGSSINKKGEPVKQEERQEILCGQREAAEKVGKTQNLVDESYKLRTQHMGS